MTSPWLRGLFLGLAIVAVGAVVYLYTSPARTAIGQSQPQARPPLWPGNEPEVLFSAPAVTEPRSRTLEIYSELAGTIRQIHVVGGERVAKGQLLFELANETQLAEVRHCEALVRLAQANLAKLESWERNEDRQIALEQWQEAEAMAHLAEYELQRIESLLEQNATSDKELIHARENCTAARARANAAKAHYQRAIAGPREEDLEVSRAAVVEAQAQLQIAQTHLDKTRVRSPIDGIVVYRYREPGESVLPDTLKPVLSLGNRDTLHLRADVDETDLGRVKVGQKVFATAEAFGDRRFPGRVVHVEQTLGRKNFRTYRPTEKVDTKILEVVISLDDGCELPLDLQVTAWFLRDESAPVTAAR